MDELSVEGLYIFVGENIRRLREERNMSQATLADLISLTRSSISNIETGRQKMLAHTLWQVAVALGVSPAVLYPEPAALQPNTLSSVVKEKLSTYSPEVQDWVASLLTRKEGSSDDQETDDKAEGAAATDRT